jgi:hypothetical protein
VNAARYIEGVALTILCVGAVTVGARSLRERMLSGWSGPPAWVADAVIAVSLVVVVLEVIGLAHLFYLPAAVIGCVAAGGIAWMIGVRGKARPAAGSAPAAPARGQARVTRVIVAVGVGAVAAPWLGWTIFSYRHGMLTPDTIWYHLPQAARFVQTGSILHLQYFDRDPVTVFYPANAELFHALGLMLFGSDLVSPVINLGWGALALLAAWSIGQPFGRAPHCLIAVLLVLATPVLVDTQPGGGYNDTACIALMLSAGALLVNAGPGAGPATLAALAAGVTLGIKFTMIVPSLALAAGVVAVTARRARWGMLVRWAAALVGLGGWWYLRNAIATGTPLPTISIHLGPLSFTAPHVTTPTFTVGQYLFNGHVWQAFYLPGLHRALGPAWWLIMAFAAIGAVGTIVVRGRPVVQMLGAVAVLSAATYVVTPQLGGLPGQPVSFVYNVRYAVVPLALGLVLAPLLPLLRRAAAGHLWLGVCALTLLATELDPGVWPTGLNANPFSSPLGGAPALAGGIAGASVVVLILLRSQLAEWARKAGDRGRTVLAPLLIALLGAGTAGGWLVADSYARNRYLNAAPAPTLFNWARSVRHQRIGIVGIIGQYPLYGPDSSNYVQYLGQSAPHGGFGSFESCQAWRSAVDRGHYGWLVVAPVLFPLTNVPARELAWTESAAGATPVIRERAVGGPPSDLAVLFRLSGPLNPATC